MSRRYIPMILLLLMLVVSACSLSSARDDNDDDGGDDESPIIVPDRDDVLVVDDEATEEVTIRPTNTPRPTSTPQSNDDDDDSSGGNTGTSGSNTGSNSGVSACFPRTDWLLYTVVSGDTMSSLARRTSSTVNQLATANCISDPSNISVGQQLRVPRTPTSNNQQLGYVSPSSYDALTGNIYTLSSSQTITLSWLGASLTGMNAVEFLYYPHGANSPVRIGTDSNLSNGAAVTWFVPESIAGVVVARGNTSTGGVRFSADLNVVSNRTADDVIGLVSITPPYSNDGINYTFTEGETITLRWLELNRTNVYRVDFYLQIDSNATSDPIVIASDTNIVNGVSASVTVTDNMEGRVSAIALRTDNTRVYTYQDVVLNIVPDSVDPPIQGTISITPIVSDFDIVAIEEGELVTLRWENMPSDVGQVEFYYVREGQTTPVSIGIDYDTINGGNVQWLVPENVTGYIEAVGRIVGQNHLFVTSNRRFFETVSSPGNGNVTQGQAAWQAFENGYMLWRASPDGIYVLNASGFVDYYAGSVYQSLPDNPVTDTPPSGRVSPINGFGKIWGNTATVRDALGWGLSAEQGYTATITTVAGSGNGPVGDGYVTFTIPDGRTVRINDGGTWTFE